MLKNRLKELRARHDFTQIELAETRCVTRKRSVSLKKENFHLQ